MYPVLGTVDSSSIFYGKEENNQGNISRGTLEGMKDIPDRERSQSKGTEAYTSCCVQGLVKRLVGLVQSAWWGLHSARGRDEQGSRARL